MHEDNGIGYSTEGKNPLKSKRFWGFIIVSLEIADLITGNPLSLNGFVKISLWILGSGLMIWGEITAEHRLNFGTWVN